MYCVDINSDEPILLINRHIGFDEADGMGIDGSLFQQELLQLDSMGKKRIQVWISSPGGVVLDGYNIFNAILKSKTPVDTYNVGIAASIAGVIFMAGRKRVMADYASLMIHPPMGSDDKKMMNVMGEGLVTMLSAKSNISETEVKYLMDRTTWMNAAECFEKGFCTEIEVTADANKKRMPVNNTVAMWKESILILNSLPQLNTSQHINPASTIKNNIKNTNMLKVTMKLNLNDGATEDNVVSAIKSIEDRAYAAEVSVISAEKSLKEVQDAAKKSKADAGEEMDNLKAKMEEDKKAYDKLKTAFDAMTEDKEKAENAAKEIGAKNMVEGFAKAGRIKNDATAQLKWVKMAIEDFDGTKAMIEDLPLNKDAVKITTTNKLGEGELPTTSMGLAVKNKLAREGKI